MVRMKDTPFTRVAYDQSVIPGGHMKSRLGARNLTRGFTIPPPPEGQGYLVYILVDEADPYFSVTDHRGEDVGLRNWNQDMEDYLQIRPVVQDRIRPIVFPISEPEPTHLADIPPIPNIYSGRPFFWTDHLSGVRQRGPLPGEFSIQNFPRRRHYVADSSSPTGYIVDPFYSSTGIFVGPVNAIVVDQGTPNPAGVIVMGTFSPSLLPDGGAGRPDNSSTTPFEGPSVAFRPHLSCYEPGLFINDFNGFSLRQYADDRLGRDNFFMRYFSLYENERWLQGLGDLYYLLSRALGGP